MNDDQMALDDLCRRAAEFIHATRGPLKSVRVRAGEMSVEVEWPEAPPGNGIAAVPEPVTEEEPERDDGLFAVEAPLVGTFYRAPSPESPAFVEVGDEIEAGQQVAIVEAMKLMNVVTADRGGRVVEVLVDNGAPVEYGQPLFRLAPADADARAA